MFPAFIFGFKIITAQANLCRSYANVEFGIIMVSRKSHTSVLFRRTVARFSVLVRTISFIVFGAVLLISVKIFRFDNYSLDIFTFLMSRHEHQTNRSN
uniref:Putative secreted protein n=1 Tax=Amblyomma parvum TaxID=251391 RepID=A0A023G2I9_AMBPA